MKRWYKSKTIWFNTLTGATSVVGVIIPYVSGVGMDPTTTSFTLMGLSSFQTLGNLYLRKLTEKGIH